jgi:aminoacyl tRNA synthase complex-interacting multifunctional protein 1
MNLCRAATLLALSAFLGVENVAAFVQSSQRYAPAVSVVSSFVRPAPGSHLFMSEDALEVGDVEKKVDSERIDVTQVTTEVPDGEAPAKPEKKKKKKQPPAPVVEIDVARLDIRVGIITKAWEHEEADKLFCEEIDVGEAEPRQIASGLREHYKVEDLEGQRVLVLANLKTRKLMGFPSHGMVMCAANEEGKVEFVEPPADAVIGERVMIEGFDGEPATENQVIKKKMLDVIFPDLKTNGEGVATYKGKPFGTSAGPCKAQNGMANADVA